MIELKNVRVGIFKLPGIAFEKDFSAELIEEILQWCKENNCGYCSGPRLWSFKTEAQRDWFILRWSDHFPKPNPKEEE